MASEPMTSKGEKPVGDSVTETVDVLSPETEASIDEATMDWDGAPVVLASTVRALISESVERESELRAIESGERTRVSLHIEARAKSMMDDWYGTEWPNGIFNRIVLEMEDAVDLAIGKNPLDSSRTPKGSSDE